MRRFRLLLTACAVLYGASACASPQHPWSPSAVPAGHYYVDPVGGDDDNPGTSPDQAWKSAAEVTDRAFPAGSELSLRRGTTLSGELHVTGHGTPDRPVRVGAYGDGAAPVVTVTADTQDDCIGLYGEWIELRDVHVSRCGWSGVEIHGSDSTVTAIEADGSVAGVTAAASSVRARIERNNIHDNTTMSVLTKEPKNDDSGAFGVALLGRDAQVIDNDIRGSRAFSYDYGFDGAGVELFHAPGSIVERNRISECVAGIELGDRDTKNVTIDYNVIISAAESSAGIITRGSGVELGPIVNTQVVNNTVLVNGLHSEGIVCSGACHTGIITVLNNVVSSPVALDLGGAAEDYNLTHGKKLDAATGQHSRPLDTPVTSASPPPEAAVGAGTSTRFRLDNSGRSVPAAERSAPTIGAVES